MGTSRSYFNLFSAVLLLLLLTLTLETECASIWYTGENKPYEFGYTIEGNQHRRESKDIHGRINGEYGFITADNVYHVTVYATDENGNFKIISMKNIKLHQLPDQSKSVVTSTTVQPFTVKTTLNSFDLTTTERSGESCASCLLPPKPPVETIKPTVVTSEDDSTTIPPPFKIVSKNDPPNTQKNVNQNVENALSNDAGSKGGNNQQPQNNNLPPNANSRQPSVQNEKLNSFELSNKLQGGQHQNNANNGLLYRFDYATDFQGHKEEGDQLGNKNGEYYSIGRDNIKRIVSYNANQFGYMPHIRQQPNSPQHDERNNQLRHYNFEWFYPNSVLYG